MQHAGFAKKLPRFIAVEGPIGVGKTSLSKRLAASFNYELLLENSDENPFLERFYQNPKAHALSTQLYFLFQRAQQIQELRQDDMFQPVRVADFLIDKDMLFAQQNLDSEEYELYLKVFRHLTIDAPVPDLVIYLQAPTSVLLDRIRKRGVEAEQLIELSYLQNLNSAYAEFFHYFKGPSLLIINCAEIDLVENDDDYQQLVDYILTLPNGAHYFNPRPSLL
ncbi:MAG TPA: deoxynucleoside kinase [Gammaproteobacteria bacterium]|jgi:deoxyadenosine/deoxycytidine kinase|nr:deoxynucleoside kinase [Gammaproteobacteria bacterium]HIL62479.1 deoxynucleoside kinase [Porticoccaceae bacterium]HAT28195.1 deoxynucleoside kinase [Gammaproteobacteria bacterium]HIA58921.1 deoxynucleoside kinase [Gammaproteobacteria bacterium]HIF86120.1 deoxynucleoside kinase [Gammaproteobacteria bacterium]|tara:strand:- start:34551 stop:35216 length:666 start_codon:yes stop_codon:yes gene_type:complete